MIFAKCVGMVFIECFSEVELLDAYLIWTIEILISFKTYQNISPREIPCKELVVLCGYLTPYVALRTTKI